MRLKKSKLRTQAVIPIIAKAFFSSSQEYSSGNSQSSMLGMHVSVVLVPELSVLTTLIGIVMTLPFYSMYSSNVVNSSGLAYASLNIHSP